MRIATVTLGLISAQGALVSSENGFATVDVGNGKTVRGRLVTAR